MSYMLKIPSKLLFYDPFMFDKIKQIAFWGDLEE